MSNNYQVRDATGAIKSFKSIDVGNDVHAVQSIPSDESGAPYNEENPVPVKSNQLPDDLTSGGGLKVGVVDALPTGANVIGKTGYNLKRISTNFTRPADTTTYAIGDAITNSTSAPTVFELDLSAIGAVAGQAIEVRKLAIVSNISPALKLLANVFLSSTTFAATNDNSALSIDDTTMELGGSWFNCDLQNYTAANSRVAYSGIAQPLVLAAGDTKLYGTMQAANAYVPGNAEKFTIIGWIALL